jgi:hypothetical protein
MAADARATAADKLTTAELAAEVERLGLVAA